jgi:hypothetical protein
VRVVLPLPTSLILLALALPGVAVAGAALAARISRARLVRQALTPVLALALWLLAVHVAGVVAHGFVRGLSIGTGLVALAGGAAHVIRARRPEPAAVGRGIGLWGLAWIVASALPIAWMAFRWAFHDEDLVTGHMSMASEILNDVYPPRHLTFAESPLRYHYGFDLLVACITALTRVRVDVGIDLATVVLWACTAALLFALGELFGRRGGLALAMVGLAGGPPLCLFGVPARNGFPGVCTMPGPGSLPPFASSFFQHPWGLGVPLALAVILLVLVRPPARDRAGAVARLVALGVLLLALALGHVVLFVALVPSVLAADAWRSVRRKAGLHRAGTVLALSCGVVLAATALGLAPWSFGGASASGGLGIALARGVTFADAARWNVQAFGALLPLGVAGLVSASRPARAILAPLVLGSLVVVNALAYAHSGDILKFGVVAQVSLALASVFALGRLARGRSRTNLSRVARLGRVAAASALALASTSGGIVFTGLFVTSAADRWFARTIEPMADDDQRAASFVRARVAPGEVVYRERRRSAGYAQWGGLPVVWDDWGTHGFGFPEARFARRTMLLQTLPAAPAAWLDEGVRWLVLGPADAPLRARADAWIASGDATQAASFGELTVVRLNPPR